MEEGGWGEKKIATKKGLGKVLRAGYATHKTTGGVRGGKRTDLKKSSFHLPHAITERGYGGAHGSVIT